MRPSTFALAAALILAALTPLAAQTQTDVTVVGEREGFDIDAFVEDYIHAGWDLDRAAHVENVRIVRDTAVIEMLDGYIVLGEELRGRPFWARFAGVGRLEVEPPVPVERRNLKKYWGQETLDAKVDRFTFEFADDEILAFFEALDWQPIEELEKGGEDTDGDEEDEEASDDGETKDAWEDPAKRPDKARALFRGMVKELRKEKDKREKEPLTAEDIARIKAGGDHDEHMLAVRKAFYGDDYPGAWQVTARRVIPSQLKGGDQVYVTGFEYAELPIPVDGNHEEIFLSLRSNFGSGYTQLAAAYHYPDEYDEEYLYTATSDVIDHEAQNEAHVDRAKVEMVLNGNRANAKCSFDVRSLIEEPLQVVAFGLLPTMQLRSLKLVPPDGDPAEAVPIDFFRPRIPQAAEAWRQDIHVVLPEPLAQGEKATLIAEYQGKVLEPIESGFNAVPGRFGWFPASGIADAVKLDTTIYAEPDRLVTATGNPRPCESEKSGYKCRRWVGEDPPLRLPTFNVASNVKIDATETTDGTPVRAVAHNSAEREFCYRDQSGHPWCKGYKLSKSTDTIKNIASFSLTLFQEAFGEFPYEKLDLVPWEAGGAAQSPPSLITLAYAAYLTQTAQNEITTAILEQIQRSNRPARIRGFPNPWVWAEITSHEVSHQWWGHVVYWNTYRDQWLSEGLADFSSAYFLEHYDQANGTDYAIKEWRDRIELLTREDQAGETIGPVAIGGRMNSPLNPDGFQGWYSVKVYRKGAYIAQMLRAIFRALAYQQAMQDQDLSPADAATRGDQAFFAMMRDFVETYRNGAASNLSFQKVAQKHLGGNLGWFFNQWLYNDGIPIIDWAYDWRSTDEGTQLVLRIKQRNTDFQFPLTITVKNGSGKKAQTAQFPVMVTSNDFTWTSPPGLFQGRWDSVLINEDLMLLAQVEAPSDSLAALDGPSDRGGSVTLAATR